MSPNSQFFTQVLYFATSLRRNGGAVANCKLVVHVGADMDPIDLAAAGWAQKLGIEWRWIDRALFKKHSYYATGSERFRQDYQSDWVMICDADLLVMAPFADVLTRIQDGVAGLIAHVSPFTPLPQHTPEAWWKQIFAKAGLPAPQFSCEHSGWEEGNHPPSARFCPPYFNFGVIVAPAAVMRALGEWVYQDLATVNRLLDTPFRAQIALTLGIARLGLPYVCLPPRYNFPNRPFAASKYPEDLLDVRIMHYFDVAQVDKSRDFATPLAVEAMVNRRDLCGPNERLRQELERIGTHLPS